MNKLHLSKYGHFLQENCSPEVVCSLGGDDGGDPPPPGGSDDGKSSKMIRQITNRIDELEDTLVRTKSMQSENREQMSYPPVFDVHEDIEVFISEQKSFNESIKQDIEELTNLAEDIKAVLWAKQFQTGGTVTPNPEPSSPTSLAPPLPDAEPVECIPEVNVTSEVNVPSSMDRRKPIHSPKANLLGKKWSRYPAGDNSLPIPNKKGSYLREVKSEQMSPQLPQSPQSPHSLSPQSSSAYYYTFPPPPSGALDDPDA